MVISTNEILMTRSLKHAFFYCIWIMGSIYSILKKTLRNYHILLIILQLIYRYFILLKPYVKRLEIFCHANYLLYWTENELGYVEVCMNNLFNCTIWNVEHEIWFPCRCCVAIFSITDSFPHERNAWEVHDYLFRLS